jgi:hypothetical protein
LVGLRKTFPIGIAFGSRVFVCDNLALIGDHVIRRKHTIKATQRLRRIIDEGAGYKLALEGISAADVARILSALDPRTAVRLRS